MPPLIAGITTREQVADMESPDDCSAWKIHTNSGSSMESGIAEESPPKRQKKRTEKTIARDGSPSPPKGNRHEGTKSIRVPEKDLERLKTVMKTVKRPDLKNVEVWNNLVEYFDSGSSEVATGAISLTYYAMYSVFITSLWSAG
eukprot:TRINITY_DN18002_c0_g1_i1.p1 TRINITY_DN18002_c0_g1~~TRINITY_DN18002_c0_g1_i1.p1  ORF type:complete len:144 (+),score=26.06 TRINITY_DN18002_c0_g1_i1:130-561(+)